MIPDRWEPRPVPTPTPETAPFWAGAECGEFRLRHCESCGLTFYYPRANCPDCFGGDVSWRSAEGTGEVYSYSVVRELADWPATDLPLPLAYVELAEGPRVLTNVYDCDPGEMSVGLPVTVEFVPTETDGVTVPVFVPR